MGKAMCAVKFMCHQGTPHAFTLLIQVPLVKKFVLTLGNAVHNLSGHLEACGQACRKWCREIYCHVHSSSPLNVSKSLKQRGWVHRATTARRLNGLIPI